MLKISTAFRVLLMAAALLVPAAAQATWDDDLIESVANPVFDAAPGTSIYYPTVLYDADGFGNGAAGPFYKMWFSDGTGIGTADSPDGVGWTERADCTGLTNPHHAKVLHDADGFGGGAAGPSYRIWYWNTAKLYEIAAIRTAESDDGINWVNDQPLQQDAGAPIITGAGVGWNRGSYGPVHLFYQPGASNAGADPFGYEYVMYYDGTTGAFEQVGLGYSADGITWTRYGDGPVLESGSDWNGAWGLDLPWDSSYVGSGTIIRDAEGKFHFWYSGGSKSMDMGIGYASSDDGLLWTKDPTNPFISKTDGTWYSKRAYTPAVLYDADRFSGHGDNSRFKLWFAGRDAANMYHVGYLGRPVAAVTVALGAQNPDVAGIRFGTPAPLLQLAVTNDDIEEVALTQLIVTLSGTAVADGVESLRLYVDADGDGRAGAADVLVGERDVSAAAVAFGPFSRSVARTASESWLVVAVLSDRAAIAQTLRASIASSARIVGAGADTGELAVTLGATPLSGNTMVVVEGAEPADGDGDDVAPAPGEAPGGTTGGDDGATDPETAYGLGGGGGCAAQLLPHAPAEPSMFILLGGAVAILALVRPRRYPRR